MPSPLQFANIRRCTFWQTTAPSSVRFVMKHCVCVFFLVGKAIFLPWIRVVLWVPAPPTLSQWTTAQAWWTHRLLHTAWRLTWWTVRQVMVGNLSGVAFLQKICLKLPALSWWQRITFFIWFTPCRGSLEWFETRLR